MALEKLIVTGGAQLGGSITISGSKNSSLPILAATLLTDEECVIRRVPDLSDTNYMVQIMSTLGASVERASGTVITRAGTLSDTAPYDLVRKMRASVCVLGPMLGRLGKAEVSLPGGCVIGDRPIDLHLRGFEALGAKVEVKGGNVLLNAPDGLHGAEINMAGKFGSTVLGTDNVMMAAVLAEGRTVIEGAASEPEVVDLANFLNAMGAQIEGAGTRRITVDGVKGLKGVEHHVIPDRIEAGTFMVAGAMAGKNVTLLRVHVPHLESVTKKLISSGHTVTSDEAKGTIIVSAGTSPKGNEITTAAYPGFPTDMQAQMCALFAVAPGISAVTETIFPQRFMHVSEMARMGAQIRMEGDTAIITGVEELSAAPVMASDLRASAALVLAGLRAKGDTEVNRLYHIDRGYEHIDDKLLALGAKVRRMKE